MNNGRKRIVRFEVKLNYDEADKLKLNSSKCNVSRSEYVRRLIMNKKIREKPDDKFYEVMNELTMIGITLHQIAEKVNLKNGIDKEYYDRESKKWNSFMNRVTDEFL